MRIRWVGLMAAGVALAALTGCENRESADQREQRLTQRMDRLQLDMDSKIGNIDYRVGEIANRPQPPINVTVPPQPQGVVTAVPPGPIYNDWPAVPDVNVQTRSAPAASGRNYTALAAKHVRVPGLTVRQVQASLREAGFSPGSVDGKMGPKTIASIRSFQSANGLTADGVVGRQTWARLSAHEPAGMILK